MPTREELDGENRKERLAQIKRGAGVFMYLGGEFDTAWTPTTLVSKAKMPILDDTGLPTYDAAGRPAMQPAGVPILTPDGQRQLGGVPIRKEREVSTYVLWGKEFPKGEAVKVVSSRLAIKLRCFGSFKELDASEIAAAKKPKAEKPKTKKSKA